MRMSSNVLGAPHGKNSQTSVHNAESGSLPRSVSVPDVEPNSFMKVVRLMTDRAMTIRTHRSAVMKQLGFGPEVMKQTKVCPECGATANADEVECIRCGTALPRETLFDLYKSRHQFCAQCGTVVASTSSYCPECGARLKRQLDRIARREVV